MTASRKRTCQLVSYLSIRLTTRISPILPLNLKITYIIIIIILFYYILLFYPKERERPAESLCRDT